MFHHLTVRLGSQRPLAVALLILAACFSTHAHAATIINVFEALGSDNSGSYNTQLQGSNSEFKSSVNLSTPAAPDNFCVRYASVLSLDLHTFGSTDTDVTHSSYVVNFTVSAEPTEKWYIRVVSWRRGALRIVDDGGAYAKAEIYSVTATYKVGTNPTTAMPAFQFGPLYLSNESSENSETTSINQSNPATCPEIQISGTGTQPVVLKFSWDNLVVSHNEFGSDGGNETAVQLGLASDLPNFSAAPASGAPATDGHFVCVTLCPPPVIQVDPICLGNDSPCVINASGRALGCFENNYTVHLKYYKYGVEVARTSQSFTGGNCNPNWGPLSAAVDGGGFCSPPYQLVATIEDDPGLVAGATYSAAMSPGRVLARTEQQITAACTGVQVVPMLGFPALLTLGVVLGMAGFFVTRKKQPSIDEVS